jgi:hypothetical protein
LVLCAWHILAHGSCASWSTPNGFLAPDKTKTRHNHHTPPEKMPLPLRSRRAQGLVDQSFWQPRFAAADIPGIVLMERHVFELLQGGKYNHKRRTFIQPT